MSKFTPTEIDTFRAALRLPRPSKDYTRAQKAAREAQAKLRGLTERRQNLEHEQAFVHNPVKGKLPDHVLQAALSGLATEIAAAQAAEQSARTEFVQLQTAYREQTAAALQADIESFGKAITRRLDEVLELLDIGVELSAEAREFGITFPSAVSDAPVARRLAETMSNTISRISRGSRL